MDLFDSTASTSPLNMGPEDAGRESDTGDEQKEHRGKDVEEEAEAPNEFQAHGLNELGRLVPEWNYLDNFWKKYNTVS